MNAKSHENLKVIRFAGELLPNWAQLLDLAARLCPLSEDVRHWFSLLTSHAGVEDSRMVIERCLLLRERIEEHKASITSQLRRTHGDSQSEQIVAAWFYSLDTMIQVAQSSQTCAWTVAGGEGDIFDDSEGGDITLRRV